jgi:putative glutamine transport system substrate-binding protein
MRAHPRSIRPRRTAARGALLLVALALLLAACGATETPVVNTGPTATPASGGGAGAPRTGATGTARAATGATTTGTARAATAAAASSGPALAAIRQRGTLRVGVKYDTPPFGSLDPRTNQVGGFDVDLARAIAGQILGDPQKVELIQVTSGNRIPQVQNGQIDLFLATATITNARLQEINFSDTYYRAGQSLLVRKDSPIKTYQDLAGRNVCSVQGSTPEQTIRRLVPSANVTLFETYPECFTALRGGRVDAITTDNVILAGLQQQDPNNYQLVGGLFTFEPYGAGIAKGNTELTGAVNNALREIERSGEYARIHQRWLGEPPPADLREWFLLPATEAAARFAAQSQAGAAGTPTRGAGTPSPTR